MKKHILTILTALIAASCSEPFDLKTKTSDEVYLCVEGILTNLPSNQTIRLTESVDYQDEDDVPAVCGATVRVDDGESTFVFTERQGAPGHYDSPKGFFCRKGSTYRLSIDCELSNGEKKHCEAVSEMVEDGFGIDRIDCKKYSSQADSTWVIGIWGKDRPQTNYFLITTAVNGVMSPATSLLERSMIMPDTYFNGTSINGFPIGFLYQTESQMKKYGNCAKPLEKGDIVSLVVYTMSKEYYDFVMALSAAASAMSIPIIASPPANIPTNITGGNVTGYFATCPIMMASCLVDDPERTEFKK